MKHTQPFSIYALLIAVLVHLIITLTLILLNQLKPVTPSKNKPPEPKEERFRLSLKEQFSDIPEAILPPNKILIPHGEQLKIPSQPQPIQKSFLKSKPTISQNTAISPEPIPNEPINEPVIESKKAFEHHIAKTVAEIERKPMPKKEQGLYDILSKADTSIQERPRNTTKISDSIQRLYGDKFNELSAGEQKYILDNQEVMRRITQGVLDRYGRSRIPDNIRTQDTNMIEFYLHPDGSISGLRFLKNSQLSILDDTTKEVIELAYAKYPRPEQKTLIRYRVFYSLTGY